MPMRRWSRFLEPFPVPPSTETVAARLLGLACEGVRGLRPYQPGKPLEELEREYGIRDAVKLASNENPLGPGERALAAAREALREFHRYPDGNGFALKQALARHHGVAMEQLVLGNGSNDVLEFLARVLLTPQHEAIFSRHTFAVYPIVTQAVGARAVVTPARDWGYDLAAIAAAVSERTRVIFVANPNNPTGTWLPASELEAFARELPQHVVLVVDEAYREYVEAPGYASALTWCADCANVVVTRTFSKAHGLAGLRVGYAIAHAQLADLLNRVRQPFNVNSVALAAAEASLQDKDYLTRAVALNRAGMAQLTAGLQGLGLNYIPSVGNFISFELPGDAGEVYEQLLRRGVILRPVANYQMPQHLRVSIGTAEENQRFLTALGEVLA